MLMVSGIIKSGKTLLRINFLKSPVLKGVKIVASAERTNIANRTKKLAVLFSNRRPIRKRKKYITPKINPGWVFAQIRKINGNA
jgi:hypothetical protein